MWMKWLPWRWVVRNMAREKGFLDPIMLFSRLQRFSQPSEVAAPTELLRSGAVMHARGLMNSQAIQHNLDWIWPYWVERQFNPADIAFVPRAFSVTHINLTNRNWTAVGLPDTDQWPIVDPSGLVTPFYDGWSIDAWIISSDGQTLFPSRLPEALQKISTQGNLVITTQMKAGTLSLTSKVEVVGDLKRPVCKMTLLGFSDAEARLMVSLRPYNPEGVSFIHDMIPHKDGKGWTINNEQPVYFSDVPKDLVFCDYHHGDVFSHLPPAAEEAREAMPGMPDGIHCEVGMGTAAAIFRLEAHQIREISIGVPLNKMDGAEMSDLGSTAACLPDRPACRIWEDASRNLCRLQIPDERFQFLYDIAVRSLILHSPDDVYPGPYTYKRFWFRDAAFILNSMLCVGLTPRVERSLNRFSSRQTPSGYFLSQEGEWDSNGEALWAIERFCRLTGNAPDPKWKEMIYKGGGWIQRKRVFGVPASAHHGLLPAGFSAEHLGPNDYYYWDDFWGVAGLQAAGFLADRYGDQKRADAFKLEARGFYQCIEQSLQQVKERLGDALLPASPYRRLDAGAIGSMTVDYPLRLCAPNDARVMKTAEFLIQNSFVGGGFFQDMTHSGINPYLTLHIAQVLLRAGDRRYFDLMTAVARLASPTGQWPEAIHPLTHGGCMGDGQHVWAAAEWVMMIRNCFVREEGEQLILCSGLLHEWIENGKELSFGPTPTPFGAVTVSVRLDHGAVHVAWIAKWRAQSPIINVRFPGFPNVTAQQDRSSVQLKYGDAV